MFEFREGELMDCSALLTLKVFSPVELIVSSVALACCAFEAWLAVLGLRSGETTSLTGMLFFTISGVGAGHRFSSAYKTICVQRAIESASTKA